MAITNELTTLVCLFHHRDQAQAAISDLLQAGVSQQSITVVGDAAQGGNFGGASLSSLGVPERDQHHLLEGVRAGGSIIAVSAPPGHVDAVESVFAQLKAKKIDETGNGKESRAVAPLAGAGMAADRMQDRVEPVHDRVDSTHDRIEPVQDRAGAMQDRAGVMENRREAKQNRAGVTAIPVVEEQLTVGKRTVDQGGVRVFRRVVEMPVEETINLREERINVERRPVNRAITEQDGALSGNRTIELTETMEEAVVGKNARVVEEVHVGKSATERTQHIQDTVRKTEVEVEEIAPPDRMNVRR